MKTKCFFTILLLAVIAGPCFGASIDFWYPCTFHSNVVASSLSWSANLPDGTNTLTDTSINFCSVIGLGYLSMDATNRIQLSGRILYDNWTMTGAFTNNVKISGNGSGLTNGPWWVYSAALPSNSSATAISKTIVAAGGDLYICSTNNWGGLGTNWLKFTGAAF